MSYKKKQRQNKFPVIIFGFLLGLCLAVGMSLRVAYAGDTEDGKLKNGSFEEGQTWTKSYNTQSQTAIPSWNTTASDGQIELFKENTGVYIPGVILQPSEGDYAAELNANEESTLYQNVKTTPSSIYEWGLDHGARNVTDTMALVIGPAQTFDPSKPDNNNDGKPDKDGRDQLMQMVDWLIAQGKTSVKTEAGIDKQIVVYSKKFADGGTFYDNSGNNAFSLTPSSIYTEEWHIWIIADSKSTSGTNPWGHYGSNAEVSSGNTEGSGNTEIDTSKYYFYTVPTGQTKTLFGFVSIGGVNNNGILNSNKSFGNFLDNINFKIFHPLSGSSTLHGSGVVGGSDGTTSGEGGLSDGYKVTVDDNLITYAVDGEPLRVQAIVKKPDADDGCEFVGLYYTKQDVDGNLVTTFLQKAGNEIDDTGNLTAEQKKDKWIKSTDEEGNIIYTYYLDNITSATDLHFVFIKSPTVTYDPNGGKPYVVDRIYNTDEEQNVYSFKPDVNGEEYTFISPYVSHAPDGQNDGWKFMGWLLTGDTVTSIPEGTAQIHADQLGKLLLPAEHTIACDYTGEETKKEQYFKIWNGKIALTENKKADGQSVEWKPSDSQEEGVDTEIDYANIHKGLTMVAQWRWRQAFLPQLKNSSGYANSNVGGTVEITSVNSSDTNYDATYNGDGGKAYYATTDEFITVKATANDDYEFEGWYDGEGNLLSTQAIYSFTETKEKVGTYYARFSGTVTQTYIRQIEDGGTWQNIEGVEENPVGNLDRYSYIDVAGKDISATATAGTGYKCIGWYDADGNKVADTMLSNEEKTISYKTTGNATYYARFVPTVKQTFIRQVKNGDGWETVTNNTVGSLSREIHIDQVGKSVSSKATAKEGYKFVGWYDADGNEVGTDKLSPDKQTIQYTTNGDATYYARFEKIMVTQTYKRQVKNGDGWDVTTDDEVGTVTPGSVTVEYGSTAGSTAEAGDGYTFVGWYKADGTAVAASMLGAERNILSYTATENATYIARFEKKVTQTFVRQLKDGEGFSNVSENSIGTLTCYTHTDVAGKDVSSTAEAGAGYEFVGWYDVSGNPVAGDMISNNGTTLSYTTTGNATYYARFQKIKAAETVTQTYIRQVKDGDNWKVTTDDSIATLDCYTHTDVVGATASSTATAKEGYEFVGWYDAEGNLVASDKLSNKGTTLSYTTTGNATYYARFQKIKAAETVTQTDNDQGAETEARKPKSETETETKKNKPETGDECNPTLWTALFLLSIVALAELNDKRKKLK